MVVRPGSWGSLQALQLCTWLKQINSMWFSRSLPVSSEPVLQHGFLHGPFHWRKCFLESLRARQAWQIVAATTHWASVEGRRLVCSSIVADSSVSYVCPGLLGHLAAPCQGACRSVLFSGPVETMTKYLVVHPRNL